VLPHIRKGEVIIGNGMGVGEVEVGDLDDKRRTDAPTARWKISLPKHAASGNTCRADMAILVKMAILV
jgi:hypothetical protein